MINLFYLFIFIFYFLIGWFRFLLLLLHGYLEGRFSRDLKEHSTQDGYEKGKKEKDGKV